MYSLVPLRRWELLLQGVLLLTLFLPVPVLPTGSAAGFFSELLRSAVFLFPLPLLAFVFLVPDLLAMPAHSSELVRVADGVPLWFKARDREVHEI